MPAERKRLRVKDPEKYNWHPKRLITEVGVTAAQCHADDLYLLVAALMTATQCRADGPCRADGGYSVL